MQITMIYSYKLRISSFGTKLSIQYMIKTWESHNTVHKEELKLVSLELSL